jgi:hypothetical protein
MKKEFEIKLDRAFAALQKEEDKTAQAARERQAKQQAFLDDFNLKQDQIIRPAMQSVGQYLTTKGCHFDIVSEPQRVADGGVFSRPYISLEISLSKDKPKDGRQHPHFRVVGDKVAQVVEFHQNTIGGAKGGGFAGSRGQFKLDDLTEDLIVEHIVATVEKILKPWGADRG